MKGLSVAGTAAMFLVGGGILVHGIPPLHHLADAYGSLLQAAIGGIVGIVTGGLTVGIVMVVERVGSCPRAARH
jgi:predicted DNA repair protein MutK